MSHTVTINVDIWTVLFFLEYYRLKSQNETKIMENSIRVQVEEMS